jgi:adenylosuccinate synthase
MILDLQFGSTGKGLLAGFLAKTKQPDVVVTAWGPNAGHTYIDEDGREFIHCMLANGVVSPKLKTILIGPGSVINLDTLKAEIISCKDLLRGKCLVIHPQAVVVTAKHRETEMRNVKIGSTMKGTGAAVIERIERDPDNSPTAWSNISLNWLDEIAEMGIGVEISDRSYDSVLRNAEVIQIEGAQGYSLSIYHGFYPYTTSRDVTPAQVMADCGMPFSIIPEVYGTLRTYPIRVANRFNEEGDLIGTSGPGYHDQKELDWKDIGLEPELTTVTKLPRRIFDFSMEQTRQAFFRCGPTKIFLNFVNYMYPIEAAALIASIESVTRSRDIDRDCKVEWVGVGPAHQHVLNTTHWKHLNGQESAQ